MAAISLLATAYFLRRAALCVAILFCLYAYDALAGAALEPVGQAVREADLGRNGSDGVAALLRKGEARGIWRVVIFAEAERQAVLLELRAESKIKCLHRQKCHFYVH
jgi:hypothetical protein